MNRLHETGNVLGEMFANRQLMPGMHTERRVVTGTNGLRVGEVPFDPALHNPLHINPLSIWEDILDQPHVTQVLPNKEFAVNLVLHRDPAERTLPPLFAPVRDFKQGLAKDLATEIEVSGEVMDRFNFYVVGDTENLGDLDAEVVRGTEDPEKASKEIQEICLDGLTFVLSDFYNLKLKQPKYKDDFAETVAVKVNHGLELELPANIGRVKLPRSDMRINTKERKPGSNQDLQDYNVALAAKNEQIRQDLRLVGAQVAQVVFTGMANRDKDFTIADARLASALREVSEY